MKIWRLVSGILSCCFMMFVSFQSCAAGLYNTLEANGEVSGTAGILVSLFMLAGGIVSITTRNSQSKGSGIALTILFGIASIFGFSCAGAFSDLKIWASWCLINVVLAVISLFITKKEITE